jgi:uncharacterized protein YdhG (YjbR/CyaY superfamily)
MATEKPATRRGAKDASSEVWTAEEKAAMQEHAREMKAQARRAARGGKPDGEADVLAKIAEMPDADRVLAERIHAIVKATAPGLSPKTWYGMPAYANAQGKVVCFFQAAAKFKARYATIGFDESAHLDDGTMWPTSWALTKLTPAAEAQIAELVKKAVG